MGICAATVTGATRTRGAAKRAAAALRARRIDLYHSSTRIYASLIALSWQQVSGGGVFKRILTPQRRNILIMAITSTRHPVMHRSCRSRNTALFPLLLTHSTISGIFRLAPAPLLAAFTARHNRI